MSTHVVAPDGRHDEHDELKDGEDDADDRVVHAFLRRLQQTNATSMKTTRGAKHTVIGPFTR